MGGRRMANNNGKYDLKKKDEASKEWNEEVTCRLADALEGIYKEI